MTWKRGRNVVAAILAVGIGMLAGPAEAKTKSVLVLFDLSSSTREHREEYSRYFEEILASMKGGDMLLVSKIVARPTGASTVEVKQEFPAFSMFTENEIKYKGKMKRIKEGVGEKVRGVLAGNSNATPILDSLMQAERVFKLYPRDKKVIVLMSDMVEEGKRYNFARSQLSGKQADETLAGLKKGGRLPDLKGAKVYVAGARHPDPDKAMRIREFWLRYFRECGAEAAKENYGPELLKFDE
jgi:hypothetical protein